MMKIFSKLKKVYNRDNGRVVWRILFNNKNLMLLEERDTIKKEVFFSVLDISTFKPVLSDLEQGEIFWTGVECFYEDYIIFHGFAKPDMPFHKGIRLFSVTQNKTLWQHDELIFSFIDGGMLWAYKPGYEKKGYLRIDVSTGEAQESEDPIPADIARLKAEFREMTTRDITAPNPEPNDLVNPAEFVYPEIAEQEMYLFRSGYKTTIGGLYNQYLRMIKKSDGKLMEEMVINQATPLIIPDSWFLRNDALYVIKNKKILTIYTI